MYPCVISVQSTSINFLNIFTWRAMKQHQFFACEIAAMFFHHCLAFQIIVAINFSILNSFDADNLIRSSGVECSINVLVFFTAGGEIDSVNAFNQCAIPVIWNLKARKKLIDWLISMFKLSEGENHVNSFDYMWYFCIWKQINKIAKCRFIFFRAKMNLN